MLNVSALEILRGQTRLHYEFKVSQGEVIAIQGTSGVGKTSLLETIAGFITAERGRIYWQEKDITNLPASKRPVSMLFQDNNLFEHLSVIENLKLADKSLAHDTYVTAAEDLNVAEQLNKYPTELSGGQRQRIGLIRTMLRPEPVILLDEPFSELDSKTRKEAAQWTHQKAKAQQKTMLMVTHQNEDVSRLADRVLQLS